MSTPFETRVPAPVSAVQAAETLSSVLRRVYLWMGLGLAITALAAVLTVNSSLIYTLVSTPFLFYGLLIGEVVLVIAVSAGLNRLSPAAALSLFFLYAAINGVTMSILFLVYTLSSISQAFWVTAALFIVMSAIGYTTGIDLSHWGSYLTMGLVGFVIATFANFFFSNSTFYWIVTYLGIVLFLALTVYDTQRIKTMTSTALTGGESGIVSRYGLLGALRLYLDFINLFLLILRVFGRRRR
jgi:FtsH-binding integral membrane protein